MLEAWPHGVPIVTFPMNGNPLGARHHGVERARRCVGTTGQYVYEADSVNTRASS